MLPRAVKILSKGAKNVLSRQKMAKSWRLSFYTLPCRGRPDISVYHAQTIFTASYKIFPLNLGLESVNRELQYESIKHISSILNIHENHQAHHRDYCKHALLTKRVTVYRVSSDNEGFWLKQWRWVLPSVPNAGSYVKYWRGRRGCALNTLLQLYKL